MGIKISTIIKELQAIEKEHGDLDLIYASNDERNDFNIVYHAPSLCTYKGRGEVVFEPDKDTQKFNAVCIN